MHKLLQKLKGGDRRSTGRSEEVVFDVVDNPDLFKVLMSGLNVDDPVVRMRASDALEKISLNKPRCCQDSISVIVKIS